MALTDLLLVLLLIGMYSLFCSLLSQPYRLHQQNPSANCPHSVLVLCPQANDSKRPRHSSGAATTRMYTQYWPFAPPAQVLSRDQLVFKPPMLIEGRSAPNPSLSPFPLHASRLQALSSLPSLCAYCLTDDSGTRCSGTTTPNGTFVLSVEARSTFGSRFFTGTQAFDSFMKAPIN
jgi:hypothetical protein